MNARAQPPSETRSHASPLSKPGLGGGGLAPRPPSVDGDGTFLRLQSILGRPSSCEDGGPRPRLSQHVPGMDRRKLPNDRGPTTEASVS